MDNAETPFDLPPDPPLNLADQSGSISEDENTSTPTQTDSSPAGGPLLEDQSKAVLNELRRQLKAGNEVACFLACESLIDLLNVSQTENSPVFDDLFSAAVSIKQAFNTFPHPAKRFLVNAIFHLSNTILQYPKLKTEDRFLANYDLYWCAKKYPPILQDGKRVADVRTALESALECAFQLTPGLDFHGSFRSSRLTAHSFWHRVAQLNLARWTLGVATPQELPAHLEAAAAALRRIVNFGVGMSFIAVQHNRARLAGCLNWLGMLYAQKGEWRRSNLCYAEADHWFAEMVQSEPAKEGICYNAFLAEFYFALQEFALAFEHSLATVADDTANGRTDLRQGSFHYLLDRLLVFRGPDIGDFLLDIIATGLPPTAKLKALSAVCTNATLRGDWPLVAAAQWFFLNTAEQLELPEILAVPSDKRHALVTSDMRIRDFTKDCESKMKGDQIASLIDLLTKLVAANKTISFDQRESPVLLSLLGRAQSAIGDYDAALRTFKRLLRIDPSEHNQSVTRYLLGDVYLAQGELKTAAHNYELSFKLGGKYSALFKAALARTFGGQFDQAIKHLNAMCSVENAHDDEAPHQTRTALAQAYWGRYCLDEESGGKNPADVVAACEALKEVLTGKLGARYVNDVETIIRFVEMIRHPIAAAAIADILKTEWDAELVGSFSNAIGRRHTYPRVIIEVALERLSDTKLWDEVKFNFVRILAKALARAYHYGEIDGLSFEELASLIITKFRQFPAVGYQGWLCDLLLIEEHASKAELVERYADEAIKVFAPISGAPEEAIRALSDPAVLTPINDFLRRRMPPATEPVAYGHTDSANLHDLVEELIEALRVEFQEPIEGGSILLPRRWSGSATVSLIDWLDRIRPFLWNLLDIPRHEKDYSARGPLAPLAAEASPWFIYFGVVGSTIEISMRFSRIDPASNPTLLLEQAEHRLRAECEAASVSDLIELDVRRLESDHKVYVTVNVPPPIEIDPDFERMRTFVNYLKEQSSRMLTGGLPDSGSYRRASNLFASAFQHVRETDTEKWVEFIRHLLDIRYVMAASWLLFLPLEDGNSGKHPRSTVHQVKRRVQLAIIKQAQGNEVTPADLAELRNSQFRMATNILFASRNSFSNTHRIWLKGAITHVVNEFSKNLPELKFSVFCPLDAYARIHRELFSRVMFNLLHNAVNAVLATDIRLVEVRVVKDDTSSVKISISNKYDPKLPPSETGTGIGLEEVRYFIHNVSKGDIEVREGADRFEVSLLLPDLTHEPAVEQTI